ncbi:hypothetical protein BB561_004049 [Smittium simulii]|uniref:RNA helicase n=1 Tax=Smittium simulii TaxID=133385 RepID=A0A2T9YIA9_9FUNG|nr:hypothetical protein BB561_004049 [Smittium simulii]
MNAIKHIHLKVFSNTLYLYRPTLSVFNNLSSTTTLKTYASTSSSNILDSPLKGLDSTKKSDDSLTPLSDIASFNSGNSTTPLPTLSVFNNLSSTTTLKTYASTSSSNILDSPLKGLDSTKKSDDSLTPLSDIASFNSGNSTTPLSNIASFNSGNSTTPLSNIASLNSEDSSTPLSDIASFNSEDSSTPLSNIASFDSFKLAQPILTQINDVFNWKTPTEIQKIVIPVALNNKNIIFCSSTGQGKTGAYLIPLINKIYSQISLSENSSLDRSPSAIILVPTSQLAHQVANVANLFGKKLGINATSVTGEADLFAQNSAIFKKKLDILVCTVGRFVTYLSNKNSDSNLLNSDSEIISFQNIQTLIVDEADYVLGNQQIDSFSYGFDKLKKTSTKKIQSIFLSSTISNHLKIVIMRMFSNKKNNIQDLNTNLSISKKIKQIVYYVSYSRKYSLFKYLRFRKGAVSIRDHKVIIFVRTIQKAQRICENLDRDKIENLCLHSELSKSEKIEILNKFNASKDLVLVSTEFGSRGIDFVDVNTVVNFDIPHTHIDYIHRAGRAARMNSLILPEQETRQANVISFVSNDEQSIQFSDSRIAIRDEQKYINRINDYLTKNNYDKLEFRKIPGPFKDISHSKALLSSKKHDPKQPNFDKSSKEFTEFKDFGSWKSLKSRKNLDTPSKKISPNEKNLSKKNTKTSSEPIKLNYEKVIGEYQAKAKKVIF